MFRTRDFVLIFTAIVFLVAAIGTTIMWDRSSDVSSTPKLKFIDNDDTEYVAVIESKDALSREDRLKDMRAKIAEGGELVVTAPVQPSPASTSSSGENASSTVLTKAESRCTDYSEASVAWSPYGLQMEEKEGGRLFYREIVSEYEFVQETTTDDSMSLPENKKEVVLQLPVRAIPVGSPSCLSSVVVGIAQDGSLIRNNEAGLYGVFGADTLVGYALDGFPIYGLSGIATDQCGGTIVNGQYQYYLNKERETILNCYSGVPVRI